MIRLVGGRYEATGLSFRLTKQASRHGWTRRGEKWVTSSLDAVLWLIDRGFGHTREVFDSVEVYRGSKQAALAASCGEIPRGVIDIPIPYGERLYPYQEAAVEVFYERGNLLLADPMGMGKTPVAIACANLAEAEDVLIVCPASVKLQWMRQWRRWTTGPHEAHVVRGTKGWDAKKRVVVVNYDLLDRLSEQVRERDWDLIVLDESHYIKSLSARRTRAIVGHGRGKDKVPRLEAKHKLALTGTPILAKPFDVFPVLDWLVPGEFGTAWNFGHAYCDGHKSRHGLDFTGVTKERLNELQDRLRQTVMVRRAKKRGQAHREVIELEGAKAQVRAEQTAARKEERKLVELRADAMIAKARGVGYEAAVRRLAEGESAAWHLLAKLRLDTAIAKLPACIKYIDDVLEQEDKVVVFHHHRIIGETLEEHYYKTLGGDKVERIVGGDSMRHRDEAVTRFRDDARLFIGSTRACGTGTDGLQVASVAVFVELDWTPAVIAQAEGRIDRIGQKGHPLFVHLVAEGSIDATMARKIVEKEATASAITDTVLDPWDRSSVEAVDLDGVEPQDVGPELLDEKLNAVDRLVVMELLSLKRPLLEGERALLTAIEMRS